MEERIRRLERTVRRLTAACTGLALALAGVATLGAIQAPRSATFQGLRAHRLAIVDKDGRERATLGLVGAEVEVLLKDAAGSGRVTLHAPGEARGGAWVTVHGAGERDRVKILAEGDARPEIIVDPLDPRPTYLYPPR